MRARLKVIPGSGVPVLFVRAATATVEKSRFGSDVGAGEVRMHTWRDGTELGLFSESAHPLLGFPSLGKDHLYALHDHRKSPKSAFQ